MTGLPRLQRPTRALALRYAEKLFLANERVDMQALATVLGVGRTTLYRWVRDREHLLGLVLARMSDEVWAQVNADARGEGIDRALDAVRRFMEVTAGFEPLRNFAQREPGVALRVLLSPTGAVADSLRHGVEQALWDSLPEARAALTADVVDVIVQVGTALEWAPIIIGDDPPVERALHLVRIVLTMTLEAARS